ncbi:MAG: hypothetical protein ABWJ97_04375 [Thermoproteus sp.]
MWYRIGRGPPRGYFYANLDLIRVSQASLVLSFLFFTAGLLAPRFSIRLHADLMTWGLLSFYFSVMYLQHPAFTNTMPKRPLSYVLLALFLLGLAGDYAGLPLVWAPFAMLYIALYTPGFAGRNAPPNALVVAGLAALVFAKSPWQVAASFPAASAMSLILRVDSAKRRLNVTLAQSAVFAAAYLAFLFSPLPAPISISLIFAAFLALVRGLYLAREPYAWGTAVGRTLPLLAPLGLLGLPAAHFLYMGIAVIMFSLCVPWFLPSVFLRQVPKWPNYLPLIPIAASALRLTGYGPSVAAAAVLLLAGGIYVAARILKERAFPFGQPP